MIDGIKCEYVRDWVEDYPDAVKWMVEENGFPKEASEFESLFDDLYCGTFESVEGYFDDIVSNMYSASITDWPLNRIDFKEAWRDLQSDGYWSYLEDSGDVHIFRPEE